jgi:hypothetical protein
MYLSFVNFSIFSGIYVKRFLMNNIIKSVYEAGKEVNSWPQWKKDISGIESDYTITKNRF